MSIFDIDKLFGDDEEETTVPTPDIVDQKMAQEEQLVATDPAELDAIYDTGFSRAKQSGGIPVQTTETITKPTQRHGEVLKERKQSAQKTAQELTQSQAQLDQDLAKAQKSYDLAEQQRQKLVEDEVAVKRQYSETFNQEVEAIQKERTRLGQLKPQNFWQKADTEDKMLIGLALLAGGISQGLKGSGPNPAAVQLEKLIDRDVQMQEANISRQLQLLKQRTNDLSLIDRAEQKAIGQISALRLSAMDRMKFAMDKQIMLSKNAQSKQNLIQLKSELEQSMLEAEQQAEQLALWPITVILS